MNNGILNKLQLNKGKYFEGLADEAKITNMLSQKPYEMNTVISYIFGTQDAGYSSSLDFITGGIGNKVEITKRDYTWDMNLDIERPVTIKRAVYNGVDVTASTVGVGINNTPIKLYLEDRWFGPGEIVEFDDVDFQGLIQGEPYQDGDAFVYTIYEGSGQPDRYIPGELLVTGAQVSRAGSAYPEYSEEAGILTYQSGFKMRNQLTTMRLSYDITGSAYADVMTVAIKDPKTGKESYMWADFQEWLALKEWVKRVEYQMITDQYTTTQLGTTNLVGTNGYPVFRGAGIWEQIAPSNVRWYTKLTAELLEDFLADLSYNVLGTNERKFIALTGEMGLREFDRVVKEKLGAFTMMDTHFISGSGENLKFGGQFKTYDMSNGVSLTVKHLPIFDDTTHFRQLHPVTLKPIQSYEFLFLDLGRRNGEANIVKVVRKGREFISWYTGGSTSPSGPANSINTLRSNAKDGHSVHFLGEQGVQIKDPRACARLRYNYNAAA